MGHKHARKYGGGQGQNRPQHGGRGGGGGGRGQWRPGGQRQGGNQHFNGGQNSRRQHSAPPGRRNTRNQAPAGPRSSSAQPPAKDTNRSPSHGPQPPPPHRQQQFNATKKEVGNKGSETKKPKKAAPTDLPVTESRSEIVKMVVMNSAVILVGETGSGKTTQIPQFLLEEVIPKMKHAADDDEGGMVGVTQPRRVAAMSVASYVADLRGCDLGEEVGYAVRFDSKVTKQTKLKFMTDGILLKELLIDPTLRRYSILVLDEAHERTLHGDVLFGLLKRLLGMRPHDLKIIVMSATLNSQKFSDFWNKAPIGYVTGRAFPVTVFHTTEPQLDYLDAAVNTILQIHTEQPLHTKGTESTADVLCFLTGQDEIEDCRQLLEARKGFLPKDDRGYHVVTLYAAMSPEQQMLAFAKTPNGERKVILATNIAETSITIEGVVYVVDSGLLKARQYNTNTGMEMLLEVPVSKAQARQRTGRAGRVQPGKCYRLYPEDGFESLEENPVPEILRCSLESVLLQMKAMNISDLINFEFMDRPSPLAMVKAMQQLYYLQALDGETNITPLGRKLADFPVDPMAARTLLRGYELNVSNDVCCIIAMLATENVQLAGSKHHRQQQSQGQQSTSNIHSASTGDHITSLNLFRAFLHQRPKQRKEWCESNNIHLRQMNKVLDTVRQLEELVDKHCVGSRDSSTEQIHGRKRERVDGGDGADGGAGGAATSSGKMTDYTEVRRAFCSGYFLHVAYFNAKYMAYFTTHGEQKVEPHPSSVFSAYVRKKPPLVLYNTVVKTTKQYMRDVLSIRPEWLSEEAPLLFPKTDVATAN